jgi:tryptophan-rich sensory protein
MPAFQILPLTVMTGKKILYFVIAVGICLLAGYIGSYYTTPAIPTWYAGLQKPDINPPSWVFAPVWTVLYILMGISLYLIVQSDLKSQEVQFGLILFIFQLMVNIGWSFFFFGLQSTFFGFLAIVLLWAVLLCTIIQVWRFSIPAAVLLLPYFVWVSFAGYLNYAILVLNPTIFGISF